MIINTWKLDEDSDFVQDPIEAPAESEDDDDDDSEDGEEKAKDGESAEAVEDNLN